MNILVAEDAAVNAILLRNILEREGHRVTVARDGVEALGYLQAHPEVDLVAADIRMPEMDGIELVRRMRDDAELKDVPVVFITSVSDAATVREAVELQTAGYILKPINEPSRVMAKIRSIQDARGVVLKDEQEIRSALAIDSQTYQDIITALAKLVEDARDARSSEPEFQSRLRDSAATAGAERLSRLLELAGTDTPDTDTLERELNALASELEIRGVQIPEPTPTE